MYYYYASCMIINSCVTYCFAYKYFKLWNLNNKDCINGLSRSLLINIIISLAISYPISRKTQSVSQTVEVAYYIFWSINKGWSLSVKRSPCIGFFDFVWGVKDGTIMPHFVRSVRHWLTVKGFDWGIERNGTDMSGDVGEFTDYWVIGKDGLFDFYIDWRNYIYYFIF